jgi:hypothetical protein
MVARKQPFDACGKLKPMFYKSSGSTGSAQMSFEKSSCFITTAWIAMVGTISSQSYASIGDVPSPFRRDVQCMTKVLKKTPHVDQVESGALLDNGWMHPFVQYHYQEEDGRAGTVRFVAQKLNASKDAIQYLALLNGLMTLGGPPPPTFGTEEIARQWNIQCGVPAIAVFV